MPYTNTNPTDIPIDETAFTHHSWCTTITWQDPDHQLHPELDVERSKLITELFENGHARRLPVFVDASTTKRFWPTAEIALFYVAEIQKLADKYNCSIVASVVEDTSTPT
jgi:hypothetical protein